MELSASPVYQPQCWLKAHAAVSFQPATGRGSERRGLPG
jgi:hypothetical protein